MAEPDLIPHLIKFVKENNYPNVLSLSAEELFEIFYASNRCYLVCWAFKLLDECYGEVLEEKEEDKAFLGDLVSSHGFCSKADKIGFMEGDIPLDSQVHILYRMFKYIENVRKSQQSSEQLLSIAEIDSLQQKDLNIFPTLGKIKTISNEDRRAKLEELTRKIDIKPECVTVTDSEPHKLAEGTRERIHEFINEIRENMIEFDKVAKDAVKEASLRTEPGYQVGAEDHQIFKECSESLKVVAQYIEDLQTINCFDVCQHEEIQEGSKLLIDLLCEYIQRDNICL